MEEYLGEVAGTLARTAQKKATTVSRMHRERLAKEKAQRFGFSARPRNPFAVTDLAAAKHFLNEVAGEIGLKTARLRDPRRLSIEADGEHAVREANAEVVELLAVRDRWAARVEALGGKPAKRLQPLGGGGSRRELFFGCAQQLPEAVAAAEKAREAKRAREHDDDGGGGGDLFDSDADEDGEDEEAAGEEMEEDPTAADDEEDDDDEDDDEAADEAPPSGSAGDYLSALASFEARYDALLRPLELAAEQQQQQRQQAGAADSEPPRVSAESIGYVADFLAPDALMKVRTDDDIRRVLLERKKAALKATVAQVAAAGKKR